MIVIFLIFFLICYLISFFIVKRFIKKNKWQWFFIIGWIVALLGFIINVFLHHDFGMDGFANISDLKIALELENKYNVTTIMLGGIVKRGTHTTIENTGTEFLNNVCFQKAFFSPAGISDEGFYFLNLQAMDIRTKIAEKSEKMIMVADSAKFDKKATVLGFPFSECDILVTDTCSQEWKDKISPSTHIIIA